MAQSKHSEDFQFSAKNFSVLFVTLAILLPLSISVRGQQSPGLPRPPDSVMNLKIKAIRLSRTDMEEALTTLRKQNMNEIMIGFQEVQRVRGRQRKPITIEATETTVGEVLDKLIAADPRYTYKITKESIINVFPRGTKTDPNDLLNIRVSKFALHGKYHLSLVVRRIDHWIPELGVRIENAQTQYRRKMGLGPYGVATTGSPWNSQYDFIPGANLDLHSMTVREILNALILHSAKVYQGRLNGFPISWKYEFIIDPDAPTGLGGYPAWGQLGEDIPQELSW